MALQTPQTAAAAAGAGPAETPTATPTTTTTTTATVTATTAGAALAASGAASEAVSAGEGQLMSAVSIQDLEAGNLDIDGVLAQIEFLHGKMERIRYDMHMFINAMGSIEETSVPQEVYREMSTRIVALKTEFAAFFNAYKCVLPVIRYFKIKQGMSPDDSIKLVPHRVQVDMKMLNELRLPVNDASAVSAVGDLAVSAATTPVTGSAAAPVSGSSATNTPSGKRPAAKPSKRKYVKKAV